MPGIEWKDFSGGMVSDVNEIVAPGNTFKTMQNADCWSEFGVVKPATNLSIYTSFPAGKSYDHHVIFPAHGVKDFAIIIMTDGTIYAFDSVLISFTSIGSVTAGSRMVYANDRVYVFYRNMTAPTSGNTLRKIIEYDYSAGTWSLSDATIDERFTINEATEVNWSSSDPDTPAYQSKTIFNHVLTDGSESNGSTILTSSPNGEDTKVKITKDADFNKLRCYSSINFDFSVGFLAPQLIYEVKATGNSYVPILSAFIFTDPGTDPNIIYVIEDQGATTRNCYLTDILDEYDGGNEYVAVGHKIRIGGQEYTIASITKTTNNAIISSPNTVWEIEVAEDVIYVPGSTYQDDQHSLAELEITWISNVIYLPVSFRFAEIGGVPIDENRPESKYTSGTGNLVASLGNYLFTCNPYFPDVFSTGSDLDKKGWVCWSWITGEGIYAFALLPDVQLITSTGFSSEILDAFSFKENLFVFHKGGLVRFYVRDGIPFPYDSDEHPIDADFNYYKDSFRAFIYSNKKIKQIRLDNSGTEIGALGFPEISRYIASLVSGDVDARFGYIPNLDLLYFQDINENVDSFICSFRNDKPTWIKHTNTYGSGGASVILYGSFVVNGDVFFIGDDDGTYKIWEVASSHLQNLIVESHNIYMPLGEDYINKLEIVYQQSTGSFVFEVYLDDVQIYTETISEVKSTPSFYKVLLPKTSVTRYNKFRWKITKETVTSANNFKFLGVFVNRADYGRETERNY